MRVDRSLLIAGLLLLAAAPIEAQICLGTPSFSAGPVRLGVGAEFGDDVSAFGGEIAAGQPAGAFGALRVSRLTLDFEGDSESASMVGVNVGYSIALNPANTLSLCPIAAFNYLSGPSFEAEGVSVDISSRAFGGGAAIGGSIVASPTMSLVPFASFAYFSETATVEASDGIDSIEEDVSDTYGVASLGAGFVFNKTITIRPSVAIPVGVEDGKASFAIALGFNFGAQSAASQSRALRR